MASSTVLFILALTITACQCQKGSGGSGWTPPSDWTPPPKPTDWTPPSKPTGQPTQSTRSTTEEGSTEATTTALPPDEQPTEPTACSSANEGRCECGDVSQGFQTYTFWLEGVQRCFTVYHPLSRADESLPVVLSPNCYAEDKLQGLEAMKASTDGNVAAARYGFSRIGLSTPDGGWTFANDGVVNDNNPMPCSDSDSKDMPYLRAVFQFIEDNPDQFDSSRIYAQGFSQNSMFSAYIGFCFSDKVVGVWQGGSGLALTGMGWNLPGCQVHVTASAFASCSGCNECKETNFCSNCQYWPIYPCYSPNRPMIDCVMEYTNDKISTNPADSDDSSAINMYNALLAEGHDARLLRFSPTDGINGGHTSPKNAEHWKVGCLGITSPCSESCETAFVECVQDQGSSGPEAFEACIEATKFASLGCDETCAPTYDMLKTSEEPTTAIFNNFGPDTDAVNSQPSSSLCSTADN